MGEGSGEDYLIRVLLLKEDVSRNGVYFIVYKKLS